MRPRVGLLGIGLASCVGPNPAFRPPEVARGESVDDTSATARASSSSTSDPSTSGSASNDGSSGATGDASDLLDVTRWTFGTPELLTELETTRREDDPTLRSDLLEILFASNRDDGGDSDGDEHIYRATRLDPNDPWDPPTLITQFDIDTDQTSPRLSHDGRAVLFSAGIHAGNLDLYISERETWDDDWEPPMALEELNDPATETLGGMIMPDRRVIYFTASEPDVDVTVLDIYQSSRDSEDAEFGPADAHTELNSAASEQSVWIDPRGELILFSTELETSSDIYWARREGAGFSEPLPLLGDLNTEANESDPWPSADGHWLYFTRDEALYRAEIFRDE